MEKKLSLLNHRHPLSIVSFWETLSLPRIPCEFKCNFYVKPSKANLNSKRWISELLLHNNGQFIVTNSRLLVPTPSSKVKHLVFIKKTSKELQRLSRSFSDCQSHTLNVKIRVFNLLGKVNCVTKSLYSSLWSSHPFDQLSERSNVSLWSSWDIPGSRDS